MFKFINKLVQIILITRVFHKNEQQGLRNQSMGRLHLNKSNVLPFLGSEVPSGWVKAGQFRKFANKGEILLFHGKIIINKMCSKINHCNTSYIRFF